MQYRLSYNQPTISENKPVAGTTWYARRAPGDGGTDWEYTKEPSEAALFSARLCARWVKLHGSKAQYLAMMPPSKKYQVRYIHKINPRPDDVATVELADSSFSDSKNLAAALRAKRILFKGERLASFRVEGEKVVAFLGKRSIWHSLIITPE